MSKVKNFFFLILIFLLGTSTVAAQIKEVYKEIKRINFTTKKVEKRRWIKEGKLNVLLGQHHFEKWKGSGESRIELRGNLSQRITYQNNKWVWDNNLDVQYGINKFYDEDIKKANDVILLRSVLGKKVSPTFSYSYFLNAKTQLSNTYDYNNDKDRQYRVSGFLAPLEIQTGPGVMWRKSNSFYVNLAPTSLKMFYINGMVHRYLKRDKVFKNSDQIEIYGVEPSKRFRLDWGFYASMYFEQKLMKNVVMKNNLALYSNYLDQPQNIDLDYTLQLELKINRLLSSQLTFQTIYDDNAFSGFQLRENLGVGLRFSFWEDKKEGT